MAARDWVREHFGEATARAIENVAATFFGDDQFVECRLCRTPVPANLVTEWGCCPVCREASGQRNTDALLARRDTAKGASEAANKEVQEIERKLSDRKSNG